MKLTRYEWRLFSAKPAWLRLMTGPKSKDVKYSVAFPIATPAKRPARTHNMTSTFIYQSANATISAESRWRSTVYVNGQWFYITGNIFCTERSLGEICQSVLPCSKTEL